MIVLSDFEQGLLLKLRSFEREAERSQITEEQRKKWLFWADIFQDELSYKSDGSLHRQEFATTGLRFCRFIPHYWLIAKRR